ncbi:hypothetical protein [Zobellella iuensis]|uniref:Uncharacterized protein n=1 Tax=Zobellella iuensis TaxID=2803811 RepID=A0ABS1QN65_9GAMM|nr:hypothetical protein [Zobellella iuensis]MBL1376303.1 hypothetical protein [Zobellella iuensis]
MKVITSLMVAAVFALGAVPAQAAHLAPEQPTIQTLSARGDGVDNRHCTLMKQQGKRPPAYCGP